MQEPFISHKSAILPEQRKNEKEVRARERQRQRQVPKAFSSHLLQPTACCQAALPDSKLKALEGNFDKYTNSALVFAHSSIVLSVYSYSGSEGAGAHPSIDCTEGRKIPLTGCQFTDELTWTHTHFVLTNTSRDSLWSHIKRTCIHLNCGR